MYQESAIDDKVSRTWIHLFSVCIACAELNFLLSMQLNNQMSYSHMNLEPREPAPEPPKPGAAARGVALPSLPKGNAYTEYKNPACYQNEVNAKVRACDKQNEPASSQTTIVPNCAHPFIFRKITGTNLCSLNRQGNSFRASSQRTPLSCFNAIWRNVCLLTQDEELGSDYEYEDLPLSSSAEGYELPTSSK